jgi:hypothetical protein
MQGFLIASRDDQFLLGDGPDPEVAILARLISFGRIRVACFTAYPRTDGTVTRPDGCQGCDIEGELEQSTVAITFICLSFRRLLHLHLIHPLKVQRLLGED